MADIATLLNTILSNGSAEYAARVPSATRTNITNVGNAITSYTATANEFLSALVNRIAMTIVQNKIISNPLSILKKGGVPLGQDIQEIFTNPATAEHYDPTGASLLTRVVPDVKTIYHRMNRQDTYTVTVTTQQLKQAFVSYSDMENLINSIVNSLYSGDNLDEFILMKNLFASAINGNKIKVVAADPVTDETSAKGLLQNIKIASRAMTFPTTVFNQQGVKTWTPKADQILVIRGDVLETMNVQYLASVFNLDVANFDTQILPVDDFGTASDGTTTADQCLAILMDKAYTQVYDNLQEMEEFRNPKGLYWNYYWHHWQTYSMSLFANATAFVKDYTA